MKNTRSVFMILIFTLCTSFPSLFGEERKFVSNEVGMSLERFEQGQEVPEYLLVITRTDGGEIRRLLNRMGEEQKRWEYTKEGNPAKLREYEKGELRRISTFDRSGRLIREENRTGVGQEGIVEYLFEGEVFKGALHKSLDGNVLFEDRVLYSPNLTYRGIARRFDSGSPQKSISSKVNGTVVREVFQNDNLTMVIRYNTRGDALFQEIRRDGVTTERIRFWYTGAPSHRLSRTETFFPQTGLKRVAFYTSEGLIERERETIQDVFLQEVSFQYEGNRLIRRVQQTRRNTRTWEYRYSGDGTKIEERQYERGELIFQVDHSVPEPFTRIESRFRGGSLAMKTYYQDDIEVLIEYYQGGKLIRSVRKGNVLENKP